MMYPTGRRARERAMRRRAILTAARAVFAEHGYEQATVEAIAERAEFGKGTIYLYFEGGKQQLLHAVFDDLFDEIHALTQRHLRLPDPPPSTPEAFRAALHGFLQAYAALLIPNHGLFLTLIREAHRAPFADEPERVRRLNERFAAMSAEVEAFHEAAIAAGVLRPVDVPALVRVLLASVRSYIAPLNLLPDAARTPAPDAVADDVADFLLTLFYEGLRPEA